MKLRCQTPTRPSSTGMFSGSGAFRKCWSISCAPVRNSAKSLRPDRDHHRQPDRAPDRVAPADPVPEAEDAAPGRCPSPRSCRAPWRRRRNARRRTRRALACSQACAVRALVIVSMVVKVFEAMMTSVRCGSSPCEHVVDVRAVDVRDEVRPRPVVVGRQRQRRHHRPEVGAADADVDDVGEPAAVGRGDRARAHAVGEGRHPVEHAVDLGHHVLAVDEDRLAGAVAQRHVQHRPVLGGVDLRAGEHQVAPLRHAARRGELDQQRQRRARRSRSWRSRAACRRAAPRSR